MADTSNTHERCRPMIVCGYRGTGKDVLCGQLSVDKRNDIPFNWLIMRPPVEPESEFDIELFDTETPRTRVASADELKRQVMLSEGMNPEDYTEELKSQIIRDDKTFRDILIEVAMKKREEDPVYWIKNSFNTYVENNGDDQSYIVSDWRFPNELEHLRNMGQDPITVRVFRPSIKRVDTVSETSLDDVTTDYVLFYDKYIMCLLEEYWTPENGVKMFNEWTDTRKKMFSNELHSKLAECTNNKQKREVTSEMHIKYRKQIDKEIEKILSDVRDVVTNAFPQYADYIFENI